MGFGFFKRKKQRKEGRKERRRHSVDGVDIS